MVPGPLDIPASLDCVALADTGVDALLPLLIGLAAVIAGVVIFALSRSRMRRSGAALGLVLLLAVGATGLSITAPASSASADDCTDLDYQLDAELISAELIDSGESVQTEFTITNVVDRNGTPPIVVTVPKFEGAGNPSSFSGLNWDVDLTGNPDFYLFTYTGPLPKGTMSSTATFSFTLTTVDTDLEDFAFPVSIVTGSGGDTNTANNTVVIEVAADGTRDYALSGDITPDTSAVSALASGGIAQIDLTLTNMVARNGLSPVVVRIPKQNAISNVALSGLSTGWSLVFEDPYYVLTYTPVIVEGGQSTVASILFTASNGNSSPVELTIIPTIDTGSGGDTNEVNNSVTLSLWVDGIVG